LPGAQRGVLLRHATLYADRGVAYFKQTRILGVRILIDPSNKAIALVQYALAAILLIVFVTMLWE
jgi:hypothetical protein